MSNNKNNQITDYKTDNITTNDQTRNRTIRDSIYRKIGGGGYPTFY